MNELTPEYIVKLFEAVKDCTEEDWKYNKKVLEGLILQYGQQQTNELITDVFKELKNE